jgi:hypothetical protein
MDDGCFGDCYFGFAALHGFEGLVNVVVSG